MRKVRKAVVKTVVKKKEEEKRHLNRHDVCYLTFKYAFTYFMHMYLCILYNLALYQNASK